MTATYTHALEKQLNPDIIQSLRFLMEDENFEAKLKHTDSYEKKVVATFLAMVANKRSMELNLAKTAESIHVAEELLRSGSRSLTENVSHADRDSVESQTLETRKKSLPLDQVITLTKEREQIITQQSALKEHYENTLLNLETSTLGEISNILQADNLVSSEEIAHELYTIHQERQENVPIILNKLESMGVVNQNRTSEESQNVMLRSTISEQIAMIGSLLNRNALSVSAFVRATNRTLQALHHHDRLVESVHHNYTSQFADLERKEKQLTNLMHRFENAFAVGRTPKPSFSGGVKENLEEVEDNMSRKVGGFARSSTN